MHDISVYDMAICNGGEKTADDLPQNTYTYRYTI